VIEGLVQGILEFMRYTLRDADRALCDLKAAHHAACVGDLAGEASEAQEGTMCWSRGDCTKFRKQLDWELQAFSKANTQLELYRMLGDERWAVHLRAKKVDAAAHHARQVMEKVLWDCNYRWREFLDSDWIFIGPSAQRRDGGRAAGKECRLALSLTREAAPG
jgi:hypothetical protein